MKKTKILITPPSTFSLHFSELWEYRELLYFFIWRDIKVKYKQTFFGILWALLQPLGLMLLFVLVFSKTSIATKTHMPYEVFVLSGLILWNLFHSSVSHSAEGMIVNSNIIKKIYFPRIVIPISSLYSALIDFFISFIFFLIFCILYKQPIHWSAIIYFPSAIILCLLSAFGLGSLLGAFNVKYRDFRYALPFLLQFLFFATQIIYPSTAFQNPWLKYIFAVNPMNTAVNLFRAALDPALLDLSFLFAGSISAIVLALAGFIYFKKTEVYFADII